MSTTPTTALGALVGIEPLHMTLKANAAKGWPRIGSTTVNRYAEKRIAPRRKLAVVEISDMLLDNLAPCSFRQKIQS